MHSQWLDKDIGFDLILRLRKQKVNKIYFGGNWLNFQILAQVEKFRIGPYSLHYFVLHCMLFPQSKFYNTNNASFVLTSIAVKNISSHLAFFKSLLQIKSHKKNWIEKIKLAPSIYVHLNFDIHIQSYLALGKVMPNPEIQFDLFNCKSDFIYKVIHIFNLRLLKL